jgi:hypothetical protein
MTTNMTPKQMAELIAKLQAENAAMKSKAKAKLTLKVSNKGGISLYGMQRFPVTLYPEQWDTVLSMADQIKAFAQENAALLAERQANPIVTADATA